MHKLNESRITCSNCGKSAPAMKYCIYCGVRLPQKIPPIGQPPSANLPQKIPPIGQPPSANLPQKIPPLTKSPSSPLIPKVQSRVKEVKNDEISDLMTSIATLYKRKISLIELFQSEQVSEKIFLKLYNEYRVKLKGFLNVRETKIEELRKKIEESKDHLVQVSSNLEELQVRNKVGEIGPNIYVEQKDRLKSEENRLVSLTKTLEADIKCLKNILGDVKPSEIRDLDINLKTYIEKMLKSIEEGKTTKDAFEIIKSDIEKTSKFLSDIILERKERDQKLREKLETLQTRYKLSELSVEEYERRKRKLQEEIDKIWI